MEHNLYRRLDSTMSTKSKKLSSGGLKTDDGKPIKAGEAVAGEEAQTATPASREKW